MVAMPKIVRPSDQPERLEAFIAVFGNRARLSVVRFLQENGPSLRADIAETTGIANPTLGHHLSELERIGAVSADLSPERRRGRSVRYAANEDALRQLIAVSEDYLFSIPEGGDYAATSDRMR